MRVIAIVPGPYPLDGPAEIPADAEGLYGLCNDCGALILADDRAEVDRLFEFDCDRSIQRPADAACPNCHDLDPRGGVCFADCCIVRRGPEFLEPPPVADLLEFRR